MASNSALTKHWIETVGYLSTSAQHHTTLEALLADVKTWRAERHKGPRDSVPHPGQYAEFVIEEKELRLYKIGIDGSRKKLMAVVSKPEMK